MELGLGGDTSNLSHTGQEMAKPDAHAHGIPVLPAETWAGGFVSQVEQYTSCFLCAQSGQNRKTMEVKVRKAKR